MDRFELDKSILHSDLSEISGGEKQRIAIIIALLLERKIFLLDEITSALDNESKQSVVDFFLDLDATVIAVSHDQGWARDGSLKTILVGQR